jgi:hypothetical protein
LYIQPPRQFYDMIYLLTAIGLPPGDSSTVHIYTQTVHITTKRKQQTTHRTTQKFRNSAGRPRLGELNPGICLTTEEKAWKTLQSG